ncbi:hypothetical protein FRC10_002126 [Ceratobasidium sp. 414]|nr:hypothetical protein FRC10_002126 [Ceratobasidium sp. 414]
MYSRSTNNSGSAPTVPAAGEVGAGTNHSHDTNPPADRRSLIEAGRLRQNLRYHEELLAFQKQQAEDDRRTREHEAEQDRRTREREAEQDRRARELQLHFVQRAHHLTEAEVKQRMAIAPLDRVTAQVGIMATQHQMSLNVATAAAASAAATATTHAVTAPQQPPAQADSQALTRPSAPLLVPAPQIDFNHMMDQARANLSRSLGPELPPYTLAADPPALIEQAPTCARSHFHGEAPAGGSMEGKGCFEDMGTIAGSPPRVATMEGEDVMEGVESMVLRDEGPDEDPGAGY